MLTAARLSAVALTAAVLTATAAPAFAAGSSPSASASASGAATAAAAPTASATPSAAPLPAGLYGRTDPTYDAVFRQGLSLMALRAEGVTPAASAVSWLTGQQCADGGWESYRANPATACTPSQEDTNSTSMAIQALVAVGGQDTAVGNAVAWLKKIQNTGGGWSYNPATPSDANSTGLVDSALQAAGTSPADVVKDGRNGVQGLDAFQLGCTAPAAQQGGFAYQPAKGGKLTANDAASAQAALAEVGGFLPVAAPTASPSADPSPTASCSDAKGSAAQYLAKQLGAGGEHITAAEAGAPAAPDYASTAWAALSLADAGWSAPAASAVQWLRNNGESWIQGQNGVPLSSALALLILDARATGLNPHAFGTTDLVAQLIAIGPAPAAVPSASASTSSAVATAASTSGGKGVSPWLVFGLVLLAAIAGGALFSYNRAKGKRS